MCACYPTKQNSGMYLVVVCCLVNKHGYGVFLRSELLAGVCMYALAGSLSHSLSVFSWLAANGVQ